MTPASSGEWTAEAIHRFWWRPRVDRWVPVVVTVGVAVTVALVAVLADLAWDQAARLERPSLRTEIGAVLGAVAAVALLATTWTWRYRDVSPWARGAVVLVCVHVAVAGGAWFLSSRLRPSASELPLLSSLPAPTIAFGAGIAVFLAAAVHRRRRRLTSVPGWLRGTVVFSLAFLLLLGIWLPLVVQAFATDQTYGPLLVSLDIHTALVPPAILAVVTAVITVMRRDWLRVLATPCAVILGVFVVSAMSVRHDATPSALGIYANFIHVLFAAAWFALCALAALAWTHVRVLRANRDDTARSAPWVQRGIVETPGGTHDVGAWHVDGWLAGMRTSLDGFTLRTSRGDALLVPGGSRLVAPVPASTTGAAHGERLSVARAGDHVIVSGFVTPAGDGPYRAGAFPVPGSDGLVVTAARRPHESIGRDVVLVLYRPCVLFLIIVALAALPGIVGNEEEHELPRNDYHY